MIHKFNNGLFSFFCSFAWREKNPIYRFIKNFLIWYLIKTLTIIIVSVLPYFLVRFTWYRILIYMVQEYFNYYIPVNLEKLTKDLNMDDWDVMDYYEVHQLDQY